MQYSLPRIIIVLLIIVSCRNNTNTENYDQPVSNDTTYVDDTFFDKDSNFIQSRVQKTDFIQVEPRIKNSDRHVECDYCGEEEECDDQCDCNGSCDMNDCECDMRKNKRHDSDEDDEESPDETED